MELREQVARAIFDDDEQYDRMEPARAGLLSKADRVLSIPEIRDALYRTAEREACDACDGTGIDKREYARSHETHDCPVCAGSARLTLHP